MGAWDSSFCASRESIIDADGNIMFSSQGRLPTVAEARRDGRLDVAFSAGRIVTFTDVGDAEWAGQFAEAICQSAAAGAAKARRLVEEHRRVLPTDARWCRELTDCTVLGGYGYPIPVGEPLRVTFDPDGVRFTSRDGQVVAIPISDLSGIDIGGPGRVEEGGGFVGGGFGLSGMAAGILIAGVLNALTTRTTILTVVALTGANAEVWFAYTQAEPVALRVELSPVYVLIRQAQQHSPH